MKFRTLLKNQTGFTLTEVMLAVGILTIAGFGVAKLSGMVNQNSTQLKATRVAVSARAQIEAALKNPTAWAQTVSKNASFKCATQSPGCDEAAGGGYYDFVLYGSQPNEKVSFDSSDPRTLYSLQGGSCPVGSVSSACPIKFQAQWRPVCQSYPCLNPSLEIKVNLTTDFANKSFPFNEKNYSYSTVRGINEDTIQSACVILNGTYNSISRTCYPKYAGKSCRALGKDKQIVTGVHADGSIDCSPLYKNACDPATQMMTGITSSGEPICAAKVQPPTCPRNCVGGFEACDKACGGGSQKFKITTAAAFGGTACPFVDGAPRACNTQVCPSPCVGEWTGCDQQCGGGWMTFAVSSPAVNGGLECTAVNGERQRCNTQACTVAVDCEGTWSSCAPSTGLQTFTVSQAPQGTGRACPVSPKKCAVDCVGSWGACAGSPSYKTYTWTTPPLNGGSTASCAYPNGRVDVTGCDPAGACGFAQGGKTSGAPVSGLCSAGVASSVDWYGSPPGPSWHWTCAGASSTANCSSSTKDTWSYCFVAGTQVTLKSGQTKAIEDVKVGEWVQTYDEVKKEVVSSPVEKVFHHEPRMGYLLTFHFGEETLTSNDSHRFFLPRENTYYSAMELYQQWQNGKRIHLLSSSSSEVLVSKIEIKTDKVPLYNLHVKGRYDLPTSENPAQHLANHNYYANGVLVHNVKMCGGKSGDGNVQSVAMGCENNVESLCNLGLNIMLCNFKSPAALRDFEACLITNEAMCGPGRNPGRGDF